LGRLKRLSENDFRKLEDLSRIARGDILKMTYIARSGHPGGSMSSIDIYLVLYSAASINPQDPFLETRDRVVVSHGHTSPGVYAALGRLGFFNIEEAIATFRLAGSRFEGHVEREVPGVEWSTGNLGQGLSAGCGFAVAAKVKGYDYNVFVAMSDAEQAKGQVSEARRFAYKYELKNLFVVVDWNEMQISGVTHKVMPVNIREDYLADGWKVLEVDGHDMKAIYEALIEAEKIDRPVVILARTVMGKGVSFMEGKEEYHGRALTDEEFGKALKELGLENDVEKYVEIRKSFKGHPEVNLGFSKVEVDTGTSFTYSAEEKTDNRSAFGKALLDLGRRNNDGKHTPIIVFDCDLSSSVKTQAFSREFPQYFFQGGVQEHNTATIAGAASTQGVISFFADFGVFGIDETYNQHRLNDINYTNLKLVVTHCGVDVGQDGKTHHCIDYVGVMRNIYGFKIVVPADPNQTDKAVRYIASQVGNFVVCVGRSKLPVITDENGTPFFGEGYEFVYGKGDWLRRGKDAVIVTMGSMVHRALKVREILKEKGVEVGVVNMACPAEPDKKILREAAKTGFIFTYEDHNVRAGLGCCVSEVLLEMGLKVRLKRFGVERYAGSGLPDDLFKHLGLDPHTVAQKIYTEIRGG
jgi:transketolase